MLEITKQKFTRKLWLIQACKGIPIIMATILTYFIDWRLCVINFIFMWYIIILYDSEWRKRIDFNRK